MNVSGFLRVATHDPTDSIARLRLRRRPVSESHKKPVDRCSAGLSKGVRPFVNPLSLNPHRLVQARLVARLQHFFGIEECGATALRSCSRLTYSVRREADEP